MARPLPEMLAVTRRDVTVLQTQIE